MIRKGMVFAFLFAAMQLQAGWIRWTNGVPGVNATGSFDGGSGAYGGTVSVGMSGVTDGANNGVPGIDARTFANSDLSPTFLSNFPVNGDGTLTSVAHGYNHTQDAYLITLDFTGMANGYLPSGTLFAILDLDSLEYYRDVTAFAPGGTQIATAWLSGLGGVAGLLDFSLLVDGVDSTGTFAIPTVTESGGLYQMIGFIGNESTPLLGFQTTQNVERITMAFELEDNEGANFRNGGPQIAIGTGSAVPEPGTLTMLGVASLAGLLLRFRKTS